jgi:hypothetical protein
MAKTPKRPRDVSQLAKMMVDIASGDFTIENIDVEKRAKASKRGFARAAALTPEQRTVIAKVAAQTRWKKSD